MDYGLFRTKKDELNSIPSAQRLFNGKVNLVGMNETYKSLYKTPIISEKIQVVLSLTP